MAKHHYLKIVTDACCHKPNNIIGIGKSAGGYFFVDENNVVISEHACYFGDMTPPQAEYSTLIKALDKASGVCRGSIEVWMDSEFIVKQMNGIYGIKADNMKPLFDEVKKLTGRFQSVKFYHHSRETELGKKADKLAEAEYRKHQK